MKPVSIALKALLMSKFNTPTRSRRGRNEARLMNEVLQSREGDVLRQSVGDVLVRPNVVEIQTPTGDVLANEVVLDFYMLGASVDGGVLCEEDSTLVVDTQRRRMRHVIPKLIAERAKPLHLTAGV